MGQKCDPHARLAAGNFDAVMGRSCLVAECAAGAREGFPVSSAGAGDPAGGQRRCRILAGHEALGQGRTDQHNWTAIGPRDVSAQRRPGACWQPLMS